jgi:predicted 2-oxoglutarate/Fe(II)-dependent dioxygenase YbiX
MTGILETLAVAVAAIAGAWLYGRHQRAQGAAEAQRRQAEAQHELNRTVQKGIADAEADRPLDVGDARARLLDRFNG